MLAKEKIESDIRLCLSRSLSVRDCAARLGCSPSTVQRWKKRFAESNFTHGLKGNVPVNKGVHGDRYWRVLNLYRNMKIKLNFSHFATYIKDFHGIRLSKDYVRDILKGAGIVSPNARDTARRHRPRDERPQAGELVQLDASEHDWFSNGEKWTIHGGIDDATHKICALYMTRNECRLGYYEMFLRTCGRFGIPREFYMDMSTSFFSNQKLTIEEQLAGMSEGKTLWVENCERLRIGLIKARSPQAKGRVERAWGTLQDRLVKEFILFGIDTPAKANAFFPGFIKRYNREFAVEPYSEIPAWRGVVIAQDDLEDMFSVKHRTRTDANGMFSYHDMDFRLLGKNAERRNVTLYLSERNGIFAVADGAYREVRPVWRIQQVVNDVMPEVERDLVFRCFQRNPAWGACGDTARPNAS